MLNIIKKSQVTTENIGIHQFKIIQLQQNMFDDLVLSLISLVPDYYVSPNVVSDVLNRLGKSASAEKVRQKLPETKKMRSGDVGEAIATDYIEEHTSFEVPIKKLRWCDHREMAMRGDDVIGIMVQPGGQTVKFLKAEAKSVRSLNSATLAGARKELDTNLGRPTPHALAFVIDRIRENGNQQLSDLLEKVQLKDGIKISQVEHLLFTFTESNPNGLQRSDLQNYTGRIRQSSVGFKVQPGTHQDLISKVYEGILNGLDD